jgi:ABC-type multidrug transport system ATPase subunit
MPGLGEWIELSLEIRGLCVARDGVDAISDVSLVIPKGGWVGLVGANGSGKTSLLRAICGRLEVSRGTIRVDGVDRTGDRAWRASRIGLSPDAGSLPHSLCGADVFALIRKDRKGIDARLGDLRTALGIDGLADRPFGAMSAGIKQRIAVYCAFLFDGEIVLLDEPFNWLDPVCAFEVKAVLRRLVDENGLTLITALHDMSTLATNCDSGILMSGGRVARTMASDILQRGRSDYVAFERELIDDLRR